MHDDHDFEFMPGIPHPLPTGERLVWQGRQRTWPLARRAFRCNVVLAYFALAWVVLAARDISAGAAALDAALRYQWLLMPAAGAWLLLFGMAWLFARSTIYNVTTRRVLIRSGVALPITIDVPINLIDNLALAKYADGSGDVALTLNERQRASYFVLWPNVRSWHFFKPQPTLRCIRYPEAAAEALTAVLQAQQAESQAASTASTCPASASPGRAPVVGVAGRSGIKQPVSDNGQPVGVTA